MTKLDLKIDCLRLNISMAAGHEHRIGLIAGRAAALLAERIDERWRSSRSAPAEKQVDRVASGPMTLDLARTTDEQAAKDIADTWLEALAVRLGV